MCLNCAALSSVISNKIAKFACNYLNPDMKHLTVVDPGEGPGGPGPLYYSAKMRPVGPKKNILENAPPPPLFRGLDDRAHLSEGLDPPQCQHCYNTFSLVFHGAGNKSHIPGLDSWGQLASKISCLIARTSILVAKK